MIQRIQTLYLLVAAGLLGLFLWLGDAWGMLVDAAAGAGAARTAALVAAGIVAAVTLVSVFLYRDRSNQVKVIGVAMVVDIALSLGLMAAIGYALFGSPEPVAEGIALQAGAGLLPAAAYLFLHLARRAVRRDVELIRSMDRLR